MQERKGTCDLIDVSDVGENRLDKCIDVSDVGENRLDKCIDVSDVGEKRLDKCIDVSDVGEKRVDQSGTLRPGAIRLVRGPGWHTSHTSCKSGRRLRGKPLLGPSPARLSAVCCHAKKNLELLAAVRVKGCSGFRLGP